MNGPHRQQGVLLIMAVILITTIASAAALMTLTMTDRSLSTARNLEAIQSYYAAYSGLQYGIARARSNTCEATKTVSIGGFSVTLKCEQKTVNEAYEPGESSANDYVVYWLEAQAQSGSLDQGSLVSRRLSINVCVGALSDNQPVPGCLMKTP